MGVDLFAAGVILLFALLGAVAGALRQLARLAAIVAGVLLARPLAAVLAPLLAPLGLEGRTAGWVATALSFGALYLAFGLGVRGIAKLLTEDREVRAVDRAAGGALGALQALVVLWVVLSALLLFERAAPRFGIGLPEEGSLAAKATRAYPFFDVAPWGSQEGRSDVGPGGKAAAP